jgi:hypothetical protein
MVITDPRFIAFNREVELAKRLTCSGLTAIRKASARRPGIYYDAFFGLSIGLERLAKLVWLIDECVTRGGKFPTDGDLKKLGHDILALLDKAMTIRSSRQHQIGGAERVLSGDAVTLAVIKFLSDFAKATRYFNIDFMVGGKSKNMGDPVAVWHETVGKAVLAIPEISAKGSRRRVRAAAFADAFAPAIVFATGPDGNSVTDVAALSLSEQEAEEINKQAQWKLLGIVRFLCLLLIDLSESAIAGSHDFIPDLREHLGFFCGDDPIIRRYKAWLPTGVA